MNYYKIEKTIYKVHSKIIAMIYPTFPKYQNRVVRMLNIGYAKNAEKKIPKQE